jgi:SSS family solute:Na+ symporter
LTANWTIMWVTLVYMAGLGLISFYVKRYARSARTFTTGDASFPALLIGFLLMSEFIGTAASVGTAQAAYSYGISAAWNIAALGIGFVLFAFLLARKFKELGENTISGALQRTYGRPTKIATSVIMIFALQIVAISTYASGGAVLAGLLKIDKTLAIVITGGVATLYVSIGGMRSVIYTNVLHAIVKYTGIIVAMIFALDRVGGLSGLQAALPAASFSVDAVGWSQICAWLVAGIGAVFSTQYVIQAISTVEDGSTARRASFWSAVLLVPFGICAAVVGMCAAVIFPHIKPILAFPSIIGQMDTALASIVVVGLAGSLFGTISALNIGAATLLYKDFYLPILKRTGEERSSLVFVRAATLFVGLVPIPLAIFAPDVLKVTFLAKSLRATLAVLVLFAFYAPRFGTARGAFVSIAVSLVLTIGWFLAGDPYGIDNAYVALAIPLVIMGASHMLRTSRPEKTPIIGEHHA